MRHSLVPLKTNLKLILYGKDLESVSSMLRVGHSLVLLKTNFKLILHGEMQNDMKLHAHPVPCKLKR